MLDIFKSNCLESVFICRMPIRTLCCSQRNNTWKMLFCINLSSGLSNYVLEVQWSAASWHRAEGIYSLYYVVECFQDEKPVFS